MSRILMIDDDGMNQLLAKRFLAGDHQLDSVNSGEKALVYLQTEIPDLILLDVQMPGMDGFEVLKCIQADERTKGIPVIFLTADRSEKMEEACFKAGCADYVSKPFLPSVLRERVRRTLELEYYKKHLEEQVCRQVTRMTQSVDDVILTLASIIDQRDGTTGGHIMRSSTIIRKMAAKMAETEAEASGLSLDYWYSVMRAAPLYDIGKIGIPDAVLQKPGKLTEEEYQKVQTHVEIGAKIIRESMANISDETFVRVASDMAAYHHERWDGKGYPNGIKGEEIPVSARIAAVADMFDALVTDTYYRKGFSVEEALSIMETDDGHFDPYYLDLFLVNQPEFTAFYRE